MKSASGKTMLVERSKLQRLMSMERSKVGMPSTTTGKEEVGKMATTGKEEVVQTGSKYTFKPIEKKSPVSEEILLDDDGDADHKKKTDDNLKKSIEPVAKSANKDKQEAKNKNAEKGPADADADAVADAQEILLADDEDGEVTIDNEVTIDDEDGEVRIDNDHSTSDHRIQQLKRKHEWEEVESKRIRKCIQG